MTPAMAALPQHSRSQTHGVMPGLDPGIHEAVPRDKTLPTALAGTHHGLPGLRPAEGSSTASSFKVRYGPAGGSSPAMTAERSRNDRDVRRLIDLDVRVAQHLRPLDAVGLDEFGELLGRAHHRFEHVRCDHAIAERRIGEQPLHLAIDLED